jgi:hypothetical protein
MSIRRVPLLGPSYKTRSIEQNQRQLVNFYLSQDQLNETYPVVAYPTPGCKVWANTTGNAVRALYSQNDVVYAVIDNKFYSFDINGTGTEQGTLSTTTGVCQIEGTNTQLMINDKTSGYIYTIATDTFTTISDGDFFAGTATITSQDSYFIAHEDQEFQLSGLLDGTSWSGLDFASAEGDPDNLVAVKSFQRKLFLIGQKSTEVWFNTGDTFPFSRIEGVFIEYGCSAADSVANGDNNIYWLARGKSGQRCILSINESFEDTPVSDEALNQELATYDVVSDAVGFIYQREGKEFYQINFPTENKSWLYDTQLQSWSQLTSYVNGGFGRHLANNHTAAFGKNLVGDYKSGKIYELDRNTFTDNGEIIQRIIVTSPLIFDTKYAIINRLEIDVENNIALQSPNQGYDPQIVVRLSKNGGFTYGNHFFIPASMVGEYTRRAIKPRLGRGRRIVFELTMTDPVNWIILGAWIDVEVED